MQASKAAVASDEARMGQCVAGCGWCAFPSRQRRTAASPPPLPLPAHTGRREGMAKHQAFAPAGDVLRWRACAGGRRSSVGNQGGRARETVSTTRRCSARARAARARPSEKCAVASDDGGHPLSGYVTDAPARGKARRHERRGATRASDGANARRARRSRTKSARIAKSAPMSRTSVIVSLAFGFHFSPKKMPGPVLGPVPRASMRSAVLWRPARPRGWC